MRVLILDGPSLPSASQTRRAQLAERFPRLNPTEINDLAALPPERLAVYSDLVFAGERATLRWVYPMTFAVIHLDERPEPEGGVTDLELVRDLHRHRPWHSASTRELAQLFQSYLIEQRPDLAQGWGGLADLVDYERTDLEVFYALDTPHAPWNREEESRLRALSVEVLMNQRVFIPPYAAVRRFRCDVLAIADHWRDHQTLPSALPPAAMCLAVCGRSPESLMPAWVRLTTAGHAALSQCRGDRPLFINEIATAYVDASSSSDLDEERTFADFYGELVHWFSAGVLLRSHS